MELRNAFIVALAAIVGICGLVAIYGAPARLQRGDVQWTEGDDNWAESKTHRAIVKQIRTRTRPVERGFPTPTGSSSVVQTDEPKTVEEYKRRYMTGMHHSGMDFRHKNLTFLGGFLTYPGERPKRDLLRATVMQVAKKFYPDMMLWFIMDEAESDADIEEAMEFGDIVFMKSQHMGRAKGFGEKLFDWFEISMRNFTTDFVAKMDTDLLLCVHTLMTAVRQKKIESHPMLYWGHVHSMKPPPRIDEQMLILGHDTASWIADQGPWPSRLVELGYGGASVSQWLGLYTVEHPEGPALTVTREFVKHDNGGKASVGVDPKNWKKVYADDHYVCEKHISYHPVKLAEQYMQLFHRNYNKDNLRPAWNETAIAPPLV